MESYDILVIILSITLAVFLIVSIIAMVLLIQLLKKVKEASKKAQVIVDDVQAFTAQLANAGKATFFGAILKQVLQVIKSRKD
jgi:hypothetical protein